MRTPMPSGKRPAAAAARHAGLLAGLAAALVTAVVLGVSVGAVRVPPVQLLRVLLHEAGLRWGAQPDPRAATIILSLRLPRVLAALLVGSSLAACGAVMQGLFRNPMASPEILGVSAGGSLGAVAALTTGLAGLSGLVTPLCTMVGALAAAAAIYLLSSARGVTSLLFIVIAGMAISSLFNGISSALLLFAREHEVSQYFFWTMGGLEGRSWQHLLYAAPVLLPGLIVLSLFWRELNVLSLGEEAALGLGMNVESTKRILLALSAVVTGVAISVGGPIGFVGLLVPHVIRLLTGPDHRSLLPASILGGGLFLVLCDLAGRSIAPPYEIRVGIITALLGSPYLISLVVRSQRRGARGR
jgi:iron complex transport system permease protein